MKKRRPKKRRAEYLEAAETVRQFREDFAWTQSHAASWYMCSVRTWRRFERCEIAVPPLLLRLIAEYRVRFGVPADLTGVSRAS